MPCIAFGVPVDYAGNMHIAVIADDLTGSNVNGALLTAKGFFSATCLGLEYWNPAAFAQCAAVAVSTDSRLLPRDEAWQKVYAAVRLFAAEKPVLMAKRIDSTLRGNVGAEIEAALAAMDDAAASSQGAAVAVVVPVYPASARIAAGGYLLVHGIPLERSPIAKDALTPIDATLVSDIIGRQTALRMGYIPLSDVLAGMQSIRGAVRKAWEDGCRIIICDAVTNDDIAAIAGAVSDAPFPLLAVDPGPFTAEVAAVRAAASGRECENRVLAIIGSVSELTRRQMEALRLARPAHMVRTDCARLLDGQSREAEIERVVRELCAGRAECSVFGVCTAESAEHLLRVDAVAASLGIAGNAVSERINSALAVIADRLLRLPELRIGALYASGGEVTVSALRALGAQGFSVRDEVLPLAVYGHILGGSRHDLPMVTKGGFVGDSGSLVQCISYLCTRISGRTMRQQEIP